MTHSATLLPSNGSSKGSAGQATSARRFNPLTDAIARHVGCELASFHTPGHKGRSPANGSTLLAEYPWQADLTELPGLDDLSCPQGVLAGLEARAATIWGAQESILSVNGASAGLAASMLALSSRGSTVLVPRNAHRSIIHGLVLSGLFPIWYEPVWDDQWGLWGAVSATSAERLFERYGPELAGFVVVSPTYAGALSDIEAIASLCHSTGVPLIVDEAHGAHLVPNSPLPPSSIACGADVSVHSLHKTLPALTQTGLVHIGHDSRIPADSLRAALQILQTSSPSYLLMASVEQALKQVEHEQGRERLAGLKSLRATIMDTLAGLPELKVYQPASGVDPCHVLVNSVGRQPEALYDFLSERGIFPESTLGQGVLFMLGLGTTAADVAMLTSALPDFVRHIEAEPANSAFAPAVTQRQRPPELVQVLSPRQAFMMRSEVVPVSQSVGRISAATIAPCPPGTPLIVAGERVPAEILEFASLQSLKVVLE